MKKIAIVIILIALLFSISGICTIALADSITPDDFSQLRSLLATNNFSDQYTIRELYDLSGNLYYLVECKDTGYAIYHPIAHVFSEFSVNAQSPYNDKENILYGGPTYYYEIIDDSIRDINTAEIYNYTETAQTFSLNNTSQLTAAYYEFNNISYDYDSINTTYSSNSHYVGFNYFRKLYDFGYNSQGTCGYLAASILLSYYANFHNVNFVNKEYIIPLEGPSTVYQKWDKMPELTNDLHLELIEIGKSLNLGSASTGTTIKKVLTKYYQNHNLTNIKQGVMTSPFFVDAQIRNILDHDTPIILFGNLTLNDSGTKGNHAVVCYGYSHSNITYYTVHMGHAGRTNVQLANVWSQNVFGQTYSFDYTGEHIHSGNFLVNGTAHCGCEDKPWIIA